MSPRKITYCGKCRKGHLRVDDGWIRCPCVIDRELNALCVNAGARSGTQFFRITDLPGSVPAIADVKKSILSVIDPPSLNGQCLLLYGKAREETAYSIMRWFFEFGFASKAAQLETCADYFVGKRRDDYRAIREAPVLVLFFGKEMVSSVHLNLINYVPNFRLHRGYFTVLVFDGTFNTLAKNYGKEFWLFTQDPNKVKIIPCDNIQKYLEKVKHGE